MSIAKLKTIAPQLIPNIEVDRGTGCWIWVGTLDKDGYPTGYLKGFTTHRMHRIIYTVLRQEIPEDLTLDHECEVRNCVNPEHLDTCTAVENVKRAAKRRALRAWQGPMATATQLRKARGMCRQGHNMSEVGVLTSTERDGKVKTRCRACQHETQRKNREKTGQEVGPSRGAYGSRDPKRKKSKYTGVSWNSGAQRWTVNVYHKGKTVYGGLHIEEDKAGEIATKLKADLVKQAHP